MTTQRPISESFNLPKNSLNSPLQPSFSNHVLTNKMNRSSARPVSEILSIKNKPVLPEADVIDRWFKDLTQYEKTLEQMATASLEPMFKDELKSIEQWFQVLSEAERTAALFCLLQYSSPVQVRFFITILQQMAKKDPVNAILSNPEDPQNHKEAPSSSLDNKFTQEPKLSIPSTTNSDLLPSRSTIAPPSLRSFDRQSFTIGGLSPNVGANESLGAETRLFSTATTSSILSPAIPSVPSLYTTRPRSLHETEALFSGNWPMSATLPNSDRAKSAFNNDRVSLAAAKWGLASPNPNATHFRERSTFLDRPNSTIESGSFGLEGLRISNSANHQEASEELNSFGKNLNGMNSAPLHQSQNFPDANPSIAARRFGNNKKFSLSLMNSESFHNEARSLQNSPALGSARLPNTASRSQSPAFPPPGLFPPQSPWRSPAEFQKVGFTPTSNHFKIPPRGDFSDNGSNTERSHRYPEIPKRAKNPARNKDVKPQDIVDFELLKDIPIWLKTLRLHKYTPIFKDMAWQQIIQLTDEELTDKGVAALGARRKMLKVFENILNEMDVQGMKLPPKEPSTFVPKDSSTSTSHDSTGENHD